MRSTKNFSDDIYKLSAALDKADAVIIGAGAGLSASAGFLYSGKRFHDNFSDFEKKYDFHDMYSGGFYPYPTLEEYWAYWSRYIFINRYSAPSIPVYKKLFELVKDKDYFVITTNVDHCFQKSGFNKERLFYTQGDYGLFQCSVPCHNKTYDNEDAVRLMIAEQKDMKIPIELVPRCPICGRPMTMNLRTDDKFVQDEGFDTAFERYKDFTEKHSKNKVLYLELGVGYNTPIIIKLPFWRFTERNPDAFYACINRGEAFCPASIEKRSVCINDDIGNVLESI